MKLDTTQKVTTQSGIEQENALLNESAAMESSLTLQIIELEGESKQVSPGLCIVSKHPITIHYYFYF